MHRPTAGAILKPVPLNPRNPLNPLNPLNPRNPLNPLNPLNPQSAIRIPQCERRAPSIPIARPARLAVDYSGGTCVDCAAARHAQLAAAIARYQAEPARGGGCAGRLAGARVARGGPADSRVECSRSFRRLSSVSASSHEPGCSVLPGFSPSFFARFRQARQAGYKSRLRSNSMNALFGYSGTDGYDDRNGRSWYANGAYRQYLKQSDVYRPALTWVTVDEHPDSLNAGGFANMMVLNPASARIIDFPASYHSGACGISFSDGHAEIRKWRDARTCPTPGASHSPLRRKSAFEATQRPGVSIAQK